MKNKIPKWWYTGFKRGRIYGCKHFLRLWWASAANPLWDIKHYSRKIIRSIRRK